MEEPITSKRYEELKDVAALVVDTMAQNGLVLTSEEADYFLKIMKMEIIFKWRLKQKRSILVALRMTPEEAERIFFGKDRGEKNDK